MTAFLPVRDGHGAPIGELRALDDASTRDDELLRALTKWRTERGEWFLTRFAPSVARTRDWIANMIVGDDTRRLYVLSDETGTPIGTVGLLHLDADPFEVDNILRGEPRGARDLVLWAIVAALRWAFASRPAHAAHLYVLSNNVRACELYRRLGFTDGKRVALHREERGDEVRLVPTDEVVGATETPHLLEMCLLRSAFCESFGAS